MNTLSREYNNLNNPALGGTLLWRFAVGYGIGSGVQAGVPVPLLFLVLPMLLQPDMLRLISGTQRNSGLRIFASKFADPSESKNDVLYSIQSRSQDMRDLSRDSLALAIAAKLLLIESKTSLVFPISKTPLKSNIPKEVEDLNKQSEKLGEWCARVTLHEVSIILKVEF